MTNEPPKPNLGTNEIDTSALNVGSSFISTEGTNLVIKNQPDNQGSLVDVQAGTPDEDNDLTNKAYVDAELAGYKISATCISCSNGTNIDLSKDVENGDSLDGIILFTNQLILIKDQINSTENGIYIVNQAGSPERYPANKMLSDSLFYIEDGKINHETFWQVNGTFSGVGGEPNYGVDNIAFLPVIINPHTSPTGTTADDEKSFNYTLTYNSPSTIDLGTIEANHSVFGIQVKITEPFNGTNPELSLGDDLNGFGYLMSNDLNDLSIVNTYEDEEEEFYSADTVIKAYFNSGSSTQGTALIWINLEN